MDEDIEPITRGTTPTIEIDVAADLTDYSCFLSIGRYGKPFFTADNSQMSLSVEDGEDGKVSKCSFKLTQEQTLACKPGTFLMQMRSVRDDTAIATETVEIEVLDAINQKVIVDTYDTDIR